MTAAKHAKAAVTPRLRFPEFRQAGAWESMKLSELLIENKQRNRQLKYGPEQVLSVSGEYGCVNQIALLGRSYAGASVKDYHVVETGDIVYTKSPLKKNPFGIIKENKGRPGIVSTLYAVYRASDMGHPAYLDHYFSGDYNLNSYLQPIVRKGAKNDMKVNNAAVLGGEVFAPKLDEQEKIADCLTSLNEVIVAQGRKVKALKAHKRGLMQQLFPREGETVPRLRFPEFRDGPEWELKTLKRICDMQAGKFVQASEIAERRDTGMFPCYGGNGLRGYTTTFTHSGIYPLIGRQGALCGNVQHARGDFHATEHALVATPKQKVDVDWLYYTLVRLNLNRFATGQAQPGLSVDVLNRVDCAVPNNEQEQQRIADCLSSLDTRIAAESNQLAALKTHKQGLMQQLFPSPEQMA
jgi:type I restriction enzyme S subunit